jgi:TPP-dependent pyruvate/acetoin dehydrogenase alpha subunit
LNDELQLYKRMLTVRLLEDELQRLCLNGEAGDLHFNKGQEAISVGACAALRPTDYIVTHHRTIAHSIAKGIPLAPLVAELLGKATGINKGMAGEMHLRYPKLRYMFSFQLVGTCLSVSAGLAWAVKNYLKEDSIVACFFGDAATSNAQAHEGINIASVRKAPLLLICENNGLAGNVRKELYLPTKTVAERAAAYGIGASRADGNHVTEVMEAVGKAAKVVRERSEPYLLELDTTRLCVRGGTLILGDNLPISAYRVGSSAAGLHGLSKVTKTFSRPFSGTLARIKARGLMPMEITPEHPILCCRSITSRTKGTNHKIIGFTPLAWRSPRDMVAKKMQKDGDYLVIPRFGGNISTAELDLTQFVRTAKGLHVMQAKGSRLKLRLNQELAWLLGLYAAEGFKVGEEGFKLALNQDEKAILRRVKKITKELGYSMSINESKISRGVTLRVYATNFARALAEWFGQGARKKKIPDFILFHENLRLVRAFIDGYAEGDGHRTENGYTETTTTSRVLLAQLQLLLARMGYIGHAYTLDVNESQIRGQRIKPRTAYRLRWRETPTKSKRQANQHVFESYILTPVDRVEEVRYSGEVFNLETEDNTYLVSNAVVHNCWHKQGQPDSRTKDELAELAKRDPLPYEEKRLEVSKEQRDRFEKEIKAEIQASVDAARKSPFPQYGLG